MPIFRPLLEFTPARPGLYFYHSLAIAAAHLDAGLYSGQAGGLLVERGSRPGENKPAECDREWVVVLKDCEPFLRDAPALEPAVGRLRDGEGKKVQVGQSLKS